MADSSFPESRAFEYVCVVDAVASGSWLMATSMLQSFPVSHAIPHADNVTRRQTLGRP